MKLIYVAIDGMGDLPIKALDNKTPLEAAETPNLNALAQNGKTGLMYTVGQGIAPESDAAVISLLGYDPFKYSTGRGAIEAFGAGIAMKNGDVALRCNFATVSKDDTLIDRRAGRTLTTSEATELANITNQQIKLETYPAAFEFKATLGHRAVLVLRSKDKPLSGKIYNSDPAYAIVNGLGVAQAKVDMSLKTVEALEDTEAAKNAATLTNELIDKTHKLWEEHPINKKRAAEGKLKANILLTRDASSTVPIFFNINQQYNANFAALADMHTELGIAKLAGMDATLLPPPSGNLQYDYDVRVKTLVAMLPKHDCFYIHLKGPDEPGHDGDYKLKTQIITAVDKYFFGPLLKQVSLKDILFCVTTDHATPCDLKIHSDTPVPLLISGNSLGNENGVKFCERECTKGNLGLLEHAYTLMPKLMEQCKK
ncbi:MAG: 2,3-bisphosphoglycerate-independent phosphoglycerate mutase [Nitrososphaerota archaeon]|nr:2,3-bisphosphoglycerate-independent phosphoglycerate mutase [Nitrososphaerota archaeon]